MTLQIKPSVTNPTIADIYQDIESNKLVLRPDFQRKFVWTHEHQEEFIDTILKGLPFPEIYTCQGEIDIKKLKTTQHVIDGQQRLTTIKNYIDGKFKKPLKKVQPYDSLTQDDRGAFLKYQVVFRDIGAVDDDTIKEIFRRINLTKFKLEDIELHNAVYDGHFITTAKGILNNVDLSPFGVFKESEFTRMADLHFILLVMTTIENEGYFTYDKEVENYIAKYNDEYKNSSHIKALLIKTFAIIKDLGLEYDSIWFRKSNFYTLVVELANKNNVVPDDITERLNRLDKNIRENKNKENEFGEYYKYMYSGTHNRISRVKRAITFNKYILE
jgi:hypothetical protein